MFSATSKVYNSNSYNYAFDESEKGAIVDDLANSTKWSLDSNRQNSASWEGSNLAKKQQVIWDEDDMIWKKKRLQMKGKGG